MATKQLMDLVTHSEPELVFAVVAPVGTDLEQFQNRFEDLLAQFHYSTNVVRLSDVAQRLNTEALGVVLDMSCPYSRINSLMTLGNVLRESAGRGDFLALHAIAEVSKTRVLSPQGKPEPHARRVHLLRSLKHPDEVETLRRVYGPGFFLIGVHSREEERTSTLTNWKGMTTEEARALIARDQSEAERLGQQTREAFTLADVFISSDDYSQLARFLDLVFGDPFLTPTPDEYAMSVAYVASLRSAQLARQVGAVVVSPQGDVIAMGANEVPCFGGGQYWPGAHDHRDHKEGADSNDTEIIRIIDDIVERIAPTLKPDTDQDGVRRSLSRSRIADLTEYGRVVHAEMEVMSACTRNGVSARGGTLYTTTFPCHNCTKHIIAAGIYRVVYVEPYPKSQAFKLHPDSIAIDDPTATDRVLFLPFVGVARRYFDLFSMRLSSGLPLVRKKDGKAVTWSRTTAVPRIRMSPYSYMERERIAIEQIEAAVHTIDVSGRAGMASE